jgi:hypothetical protein
MGMHLVIGEPLRCMLYIRIRLHVLSAALLGVRSPMHESQGELRGREALEGQFAAFGVSIYTGFGFGMSSNVQTYRQHILMCMRMWLPPTVSH